MAEAVKALFSGTKPAAEHKDKLASKKAHERELHDALKQAQRTKKEEAKKEKEAAKALLKEERMMHDTKRAAADQRRQAHRDEHRATGQACEHGVWRCRICFPHNHPRH